MPTSVSPKRITLEVCVTTADEAVGAVAAGADRLELCSALEVGGVTPSPGTFLDVRAAVAVPLFVLLRPRPGGFSYSPHEWATVRRDADWFLTHGADGIVGGALTGLGAEHRPRTLHRERCQELVRAAGGRAVLHRCFDVLADFRKGLAAALDMGFSRVLTSGGAASAIDGAGVIREVIRRSAGRIEVLPGGGIHFGNVAEVVAATGCDQVHGSFRTAIPTARHPLTDAMGPETITDPTKVEAVRRVLDRLSAR